MRPLQRLITYLSITTIALVIFASHQPILANIWEKDIETLKKSVVNIKNVIQIALETETRGTAHGTGFIVDAADGIIATNQHVVGVGPSTNEVTFYNGEIADARIIYTDPVNDMAFLKVDSKTLTAPLTQVILSSAIDLSPGEPLLMIGNNQVEEYSIKTGEVSNVFANKGYLYASYIHSSFDRAGGSSGSPVWNKKKQVVGIHAAGTETSSFELYIDYLRDALQAIKKNQQPKRGYIGVDIELISFGEAERYYKVPSSYLKQLPTRNSQHLVRKLPLIAYILPMTSGSKALEVGDILWSVDGKPIFDNLYILDQILNTHVGDSISIEIFRNGQLMKKDVQVEDLEKTRIDEFIRFSGATFHTVTPFLKRDFGIIDDGVFMNYAVEGSPFDLIARKNNKGNYQVVIHKFDGHDTSTLASFYAVLKSLNTNVHTYLVLRDFGTFNINTTTTKLTLTSRFGPLEFFRRNPATNEWLKETD